MADESSPAPVTSGRRGGEGIRCAADAGSQVPPGRPPAGRALDFVVGDHSFELELRRRFGSNIVHARERAGISQEEAAIRASLHRTEISQLERGLRLPRIDTLVKLAGALSAPPNELLDGIVWSPGSMRAGRFEDGGASGMQK